MSTIEEDFSKVKKTIETTYDITQFPALKNFVKAFSEKWNPDNIMNSNPAMISSGYVSKYNDFCDYLRLKVDFEYTLDLV